MSLLDRFFQEQHAPLPSAWKSLHTPEQIDEIVERSHHQPIGIFKHSTHCGISVMAKHQLERDWGQAPHELDFYYLDLLQHRPVSNLIAERLGVTHQSPQVIIVQRGEVHFHTSHHRISVQGLQDALRTP